MYGHKIPTRLDVLLNQVAYPVELPEYAMPKPVAIEEGDLEPFFIPDKNSMVMSRISISMMIDLCYRVIQFKIMHEHDIIEIYTYLSSYIQQLNQFADVSEAMEYLAKAKRFQEVLYRSVRILSHTNTKAKQLIRNESALDFFIVKERV